MRWRQWLALPATPGLRVSEVLRAVGSPPALNYLVLTAVAHRLDGWQWTGRHLYPKAAAAHFRRAAWILRNLTGALFGAKKKRSATESE